MRLIWYPRESEAIVRKTAHLDLTHRGAYDALLDHYYISRKPLPANAEQLHSICRAIKPQDQAAVDAVVKEFFEFRDGEYHNDRADEEIHKAAGISKKRAKAARCKAHKDTEQKHSNSTASAEQTDIQKPTQLTINSKEVTSLRSVTTPSKREKPAKPPAEKIELPEWVPPDAWAAFVEMRVRIRALLTPYAVKLNLKKLEELRNQGHDPRAVLDQSTANSWKGLFPIKPDAKPSKHTGFQEKNYDTGVKKDGTF